VVLLILDYYPLGRLTLGGGLKGARWLLLEKAPFFVLSLLSSLITLWAQHTGGALTTLEVTPLIVRILVALRAYAFYIYKMALPIDLAPYYPYPRTIDFFAVEYIVSFILLIVITSFCIWSVKRDKLFSAVWFYYLVTLIPVIGIVQVGEQAAADRYTYIPSLAPFLLAGLGAGIALERYSKKQYQIAIIAALVILSGILANKTLKQIAIWRDSMTLWSYEIKLFPDKVALAHNNLGYTYYKQGRIDEAIEEFHITLTLNPYYAKAHNNLGLAYYEQGWIDKAREEYVLALELNPDYPIAHYNLGNLYAYQGLIDEAIEEYKTAIRLNPALIDAHNNLGLAYATLGRIDEAIEEYRKSIGLKPDLAEAHFNLGLAYWEKGLKKEAIKEFEDALKIKPDYRNARDFLRYLSGQ
jgi:tetratricopeptide (TPR) repeat protein